MFASVYRHKGGSGSVMGGGRGGVFALWTHFVTFVLSGTIWMADGFSSCMVFALILFLFVKSTFIGVYKPNLPFFKFNNIVILKLCQNRNLLSGLFIGKALT